MFTFKELFEAKDAGGHGSEKHHVTAFTRMNPPTTGHMQVISKLHAVSKEHGAEHSLVVSHSNDVKKNPLTADQKIKHLNRYSPETKVSSSSKESPTILHHAAELHKQGVQHLHVIAGSDRHEQMHKLLHQYNGKEAGHGHYNFKSITMHSSGDRDPDSEGTEGMSGTKMRQHAHDNNFKEFRKGVPSHVSDKHAHELMNDVRKGSGIKEEAISYQTFMEVRMSAAMKLQKAFQREQEKSAAARKAGEELLKKPTPQKTNEQMEEEMHFTESVHDNRTGFAKRKREDDEGGELHRHTYKFKVSKPGIEDGKKHDRHVTTPLTPRKKHELEHLARAHLTKQGYEIHEEVVVEGEDRGPYKQKSAVVIAPKEKKAKTYGNIVSKLRPVAEEAEQIDEISQKLAGNYYGAATKKHIEKVGVKANMYDRIEKDMGKQRKAGVDRAMDRVTGARKTNEEVESIEESMADSWNKVQSMDKGSLTGGKEQVKKHLDYLTAVHSHHKKFGNDTLKVRKKIEGIKRSHIAEESDAHAKSEENKRSAESAKSQGDMFAHHMHMADHHDNLAQWHSEKGRHSVADTHAAKAEEHHEKAMSLKEETIDEATPYYNKPSFLKNMGRIAKQERLAREKKEAEAKKPVKEETMDEAATGAKPGWMLRQDPALAKKLKDQQARKKFVAGEPTKKEVKEETQENEMGLKSFSTIVKEGTLQSSGDDSIPTLTHAPVAPTIPRKYIKGTPEHKAHKATKKPINGHPTGKYNEEVEQIDEKSEQARRNKTMKNMMDASRGARFKLNNPVPDAGPEHKTGQAHNKAIGRALRKEDAELEEAKHVAPTNKKPAVDVDKVHAAGQEPHHETFETVKKTVRKEGYTFSDLVQALKEGMWPGTPEYKAKYDGAKQGGGSGVKKGTRYGGSLQKDEPEHDDDAPKAGRPTGAKSGARKNLGNSKLHK